LVYRELADGLPEGAFSTEELLLVAQKLIDLAKLGGKDIHRVPARQSVEYYSCDVVTAFKRFPWRILAREYCDEDCEPMEGVTRWSMKMYSEGGV
jgi:hypothetical protein